MPADEAWHDVWALVRSEPEQTEDKPDAIGVLQRLCRAAATALPAIGVGVSVMSQEGVQVMVVASDETHETVEELQFTVGEGPCLEAHRSGGPVLMPDLAVAARNRWPGYAPAAQDLGVRAVFAFPLQVGAARLGALDVYQDKAGPLPVKAVTLALTFADVALQTLLDAQREADEAAPMAEEAMGGRLELYQAQGMVMVQLGVSLSEAMTRLRAYSYAHSRRVSDVAADIVARRLVMDADVPEEGPPAGQGSAT